MLLLERGRMRESTRRDTDVVVAVVAGHEIAYKRRAETIPRTGVPSGLAPLGAAVLGLDGGGPLWHVLGGKGPVLGAPGGVVETFGERIIFGLTIF